MVHLIVQCLITSYLIRSSYNSAVRKNLSHLSKSYVLPTHKDENDAERDASFLLQGGSELMKYSTVIIL